MTKAQDICAAKIFGYAILEAFKLASVTLQNTIVAIDFQFLPYHILQKIQSVKIQIMAQSFRSA